MESCLTLLVIKGLYAETSADALLKSIAVHVGGRAPLSKLVAALKVAKNPVVK